MQVDNTIVGYNEAIDVAVDCFNSGLIAFAIDGPPGVGKTFSRHYIRPRINVQHMFMLKPSHHEPVDFYLPVPDHSTHTVHFYPSDTLLPTADLKGGCLVVWDEAADAAVPMQNMMCQAIFENQLHGYDFPPRTYHLLTFNRVADRAGANRIVTKLGNRLGKVTLRPTSGELFDYGVRNNWNPMVLAFLKLLGDDPINPNDREKGGIWRPTYFNSFDPNDPAQAVNPIFASSRSWEFVSNLMNYLDKTNPKISDIALATRVASLVGNPVATKFVPFRTEASEMPNPDDILNGKKVAFPKKTSILWSLTITLVSRVQKHQWKAMDNWLKQGPMEFRILAVRLAFDTKSAKLIGPDFNATLQEPDIRQAISPTMA